MQSLFNSLPVPYWTSGDVYTHQKFKAFEHSHNHNTQVKFNCFDHVYEKYDWTMDLKPFKALLKERALQLRESYDYLVLSYSGGHDSHTILNAFVDNGIFIDEIYVERYHPLSEDSLSNREQTAGIQYLNSIRNKIPKTKVSIHELSEVKVTAAHSFSSNGDFFKTRNNFNLILAEEYYYVFDNKDIRQIYDRKDYCNIKGVDKPRIMKRGDNYYCYFVDNQFKGLINPDMRIEFFYISPDLPELHIKQCQIIKEIIKNMYPNLDDLEPLFHPKHEFRHTINDYLRDRLPSPFSLSAAGKPSLDKKYGVTSLKFLETWDSWQKVCPDEFNKMMQLRTDLNADYGYMFNEGDVLCDYTGVISRLYDLGA